MAHRSTISQPCRWMYSEVMRIPRAVCTIYLFVAPLLAGDCPGQGALALLKHQIAYEGTGQAPPLRGLPVIHMDVWSRGPITGFYIHDQLRDNWSPDVRLTYIFGKDGLQGGGTCPVKKDWRGCIAGFASGEGATAPVSTCKATIDLRAVPAWKPSPNDQAKKRIADELRKEIEAHFQGSQVQAIVIRDFNLMDNQITMYLKMPDGDYLQGCGFYANRKPHCEDWHLFGQAPVSSIRKWIFARPYRLK